LFLRFVKIEAATYQGVAGVVYRTRAIISDGNGDYHRYKIKIFEE
jgi:hypothetical protein